jgi:hypothetical protein
MPSAAAFIRAFGLQAGAEFGGHRVLKASHVGHEPVVQFKSYTYPLRLVFERAAGGGGAGGESKASAAAALLKALRAHTAQPRTVYSQYGSPYECRIKSLKLLPAASEAEESGEEGGGEEEGGEEGGGGGAVVVIVGKGAAERRHDVPTLAEVHAESGEAAEEAALASSEAVKAAFRVLKSRFATSKCARCHEIIDPGAPAAAAARRSLAPSGERSCAVARHAGRRRCRSLILPQINASPLYVLESSHPQAR